jgi:ribosomal protein S18 acetylase RimI-like enzyme
MTQFPDDTAGEFPPPSREFTDREDRSVTVRTADEDDYEALVGMYLDFHPEDRAQGIPPSREDGIRDWLDAVTGPECPTVVAVVDGDIVGHAMLVPDQDGAYELAIFVLQAYQSAGIGTELVRTLLGLAQQEGLVRVWLTVERWNDAAVRLYHSVGFETTEESGLELEMGIRLAA